MIADERTRLELFEAIFDAAAVGVALVDLEGHFVTSNRALQTMLGYSDDELKGRRFIEFTHADDVGAHQPMFAELLGGVRESYELAKRFVCRDGRIAHVQITASRLRDSFVLGIVKDVTPESEARAERDQLLEQLGRSQERLGVALTSVDMGFWEWDVAFDQMVWSEEMSRVCGLPVAPITGRFGERFYLIHRDDVAMVKETVRSALADATQRTLECEFRIIRPAGEECWLLARAHIFRNESGEAVRVLGVMIDITNRRQLQQHLLEAQKLEAVGRFASGIAHEFNNVLTIIVGQCDVMRVGTVTRGVLAQGLADIAEAAERACHLTQQLLTFSREGHTDPQVLNPGTVIARLAGYLQSIAGEHRLQLDLSADVHNIVMDQQQLEQAIVNLVVNARDGSPALGVITLAANNGPDDRVIVSVTDHGTGIDNRAVARIFEPFSTTTRTRPGVGLGLAVVRTVVEGAGGEIRVDTAPGRGTTFELRFPGV
jgi:two-component system, cell cycle sensor histidine kinase and response regulator CckA